MNEVQTNAVTIPIPTGSTIKPEWPVAISSEDKVTKEQLKLDQLEGFIDVYEFFRPLSKQYQLNFSVLKRL